MFSIGSRLLVVTIVGLAAFVNADSFANFFDVSLLVYTLHRYASD